MALLGTLVDSFCGAALDTARWNAVNAPGNSGTQAGCRYTFIVQAGATGDASLVSDAAYDLTGSHLHVELADAGVQELGLETYPIILAENPANQDDALLIVVSNGLVGLYEFVSGVPNGLAFPPYNPVTMRWWRIREAAGTAYYESAPDVQGPWTVRATLLPSINITALYAKLRVFDFLALGTAKQVAMSNVNYLTPPALPFPDGGLVAGMEIAFGADLAGDQALWPWVTMTPPDAPGRLMDQEITVGRGRADETSDVSPTTASIDLDNPDGWLTPDNAMSPYYPNVDLGAPARWWIAADLPRAYLMPAYPSSAQVATTTALDIAGDLDVRVDMHLKTTAATGEPVSVAGRGDAGAAFSWRLTVAADRTVTLAWSPTGAAPLLEAVSTMPVVPSSARATLRVTLDVDNGAGGYDVRFYLGDEGVEGAFTQVGATVTGVGTTSVADVTEPLILGAAPDLGALYSLDADIYAFQLRDGIGGALVADADFTAQVSGLPQFVDSVGLLWTMVGAAALTDRWYRIVGTVDSWEPRWPWGDLSAQQPAGLGVGEARVGTEIAGLLRRLGQGQSPLASPLVRALSVSPAVRAYWPMEDGKDSSQIASGLPGGSPMTVIGTLDYQAEAGLPGSGPLPAFTATPTTLSGTIMGPFAGAWQADWYFLAEAGPGAPTAILTVQATGGSTVGQWLVYVSAASITVEGRNPFGTVITTNTVGVPNGFYGRWQHLRLMVRQNAALVEWSLAWEPVTIPPTTGFTLSGSVAGSVGAPASATVPANAALEGIAMGQLAVLAGYDLDVGNGASIGWAGDTAVERMARLCTEQRILFRVIGSPAGSSRMGVQQSATLLELLNDARDADGGILYEMPDAVGLIYRTRASLYNQPPNMILDALGDHPEITNPFLPVRDDQRIRNDVTVTRRDGTSRQVVDEASVAKVGTYDESVTLNLYQDSQIEDAAGWRLHQGTVPGMRYPLVGSDLGGSPRVIGPWLTVDLGSRVWVINLPPQHPTGTVDVMVEGYAEPISPTTWVPEANCSPGSVWDVAVLPGEGVGDEYLFRADTDGSELALPIDADDTAAIVTVTDGPEWTDDPLETPFDIAIGGERITVTGVNAPAGSSEFAGSGSAEDTTPTVSFVAPSVVAPAAGDLLICAWCSYEDLGTYTLPGGMTAAVLTDGTYTSMEDATQVLGGSGATGTRTATFSSSDTWSALSVVAHSALGTPGIQELLSGVDTSPSGAAQPVTLTTVLPVAVGAWLLAIQGWDWDPGGTMGAPSGGGWVAVADSMLVGISTSRVRAWARRVTTPGIQSVTFGATAGIDDNHARLYVLTGVTGVTQAFTIVRSINGVAKSHAAGADVRLWDPPVLAR